MPERSIGHVGRRGLTAAAAGVLLSGLLLGGCGGDEEPKAAASPSGSAPAATPQGNVKGLKESEPKTIKIPKINVSAPVGLLGLMPNGEVEVPPLSKPNLTGWYKEGVTPGEIGPSVILGHVDAHKKKAVFFDLKKLEKGDTIEVTREDGTTAVFQVTRMQTVDKDAFPHKKVFGADLDHSSLRLVTCGGAFDASSGHYKNNVIAYAKFVKTA